MKLTIFLTFPISCRIRTRVLRSSLVLWSAASDSATAPPITSRISIVPIIMPRLPDYQYICTVGYTSVPFSNVYSLSICTAGLPAFSAGVRRAGVKRGSGDIASLIEASSLS